MNLIGVIPEWGTTPPLTPRLVRTRAMPYQRNQRGPSKLPANTGTDMPTTYQTARKGAPISTQYSA